MQPSHSNPQRAPLAASRSVNCALGEALRCEDGIPVSTTMTGACPPEPT
jgi:hypothetical protein